MISQMDAAGIERAFLIAMQARPGRHPPWHMPYEWIAEAVADYPDRFQGLAGVDPTEGMALELERAVKELAPSAPTPIRTRFELPPNDRRYYPFYAKCCSRRADPDAGRPVAGLLRQAPLRSVGRPITLDAVACDFPEAASDRHPRRHSVDTRR